MIGFLYFWIINSIGAVIALWYGKRTPGWRWSEYFVMIFWPILGIFVLSYFGGVKILLYFLASALVGFFCEIQLNLSFEKILGEKFYIYKNHKKLTWKESSSILTLPFWGAAGIIFLTIAKILGI